MRHYSLRHAFSLRRFHESLMHALHGVWRLFGITPNCALHAAMAAIALLAALLLQISTTEWCIVLIAIAAVIAAEAANTAIEALADRVTREQDPLIADAKDLAAAAVLIISIGAAVIGIIIFLPKIVALFQ